MKFSERVKAARKHAGYTQVQLARLVTGDPEAGNSVIERIENRPEQERSDYTTQIAHHCKVNPMWLATGAGEMWVDTATVSDGALLLAVAWDHLRSPVREITAIDILNTALDAMPNGHSARRPLEKMRREMQSKRQIHADLGGRPLLSRAPKPALDDAPAGRRAAKVKV